MQVILMSATIDYQIFVDYFSDWNPAVVKISGRCFPVDRFYLEDVIQMVPYYSCGAQWQSPHRFDQMDLDVYFSIPVNC